MANIDDTIGLPNSHPAIEYRQTRTNPSARLARQVEGGGSAGRWIRLPAVVAQNCSGSIDSQKRPVFDLRNALRAGRALSTSIDEIGFGDLQRGELFELTPSRSQTQGLEKADKPDLARRRCLERHQEARRWECRDSA
jgi:hypothetical protein